MSKGVKRQIEEKPIKKEGGISHEDIKKLVDFVFRNNKSREILDSNLYITDNKEYLYFKYGTFTTGLEGFKNIYKQGFSLGIENVYYNGCLLDEEQRKEVFNKLLK